MHNLVALRFSRFVDWTHNGGSRSCHSSMPSAPLRSGHLYVRPRE
jgi:hypothetical protein